MPRRLLLLNVVGLTPDLLAFAPRLNALGRGHRATLTPPLPAVTCTSQATLLTGELPRAHGAVANGWYFRDLAEVLFWRQSNALVQGPKLWDDAKARFGAGFSTAQMFWWYNMYAEVEYSATPRPVYPVDGRKLPSCYCEPPSLKAVFDQNLSTFPLFDFWGPSAGLKSSQWIADATRLVMDRHLPNLVLCYLPHLDYDLQRFGPSGPEAKAAVEAIDQVAGELTDHAQGLGYEVVVVSEYGIEAVDTPVHINRALREAGLLRAQRVDTGWELLDAGASEAFAVADHQVAHIYVKRPEKVAAVKALLSRLPGVERVLDADGKAQVGLDHPRAGELVAVAEPGCWFTYYFWLDERRRPDYAPTVDIHRKPGYDPVELLLNPKLVAPKLKIGAALLKKALGMRYTLDVISTDARLIRGSHGRLPSSTAFGPLLLSTIALPGAPEHLPMTAVKALLLDALA